MFEFINQNLSNDILIYSSQSINQRNEQSSFSKEIISNYLENLMGEVALYLKRKNFKKFIIAGGETSGAVALALNFSSYSVSKSIAPGVPILIPTNDINSRIVYKSGNFGDKDFFNKAILTIGGQNGRFRVKD